MLVLGYADWCGHCQKFKPIWNQFKVKYGKILDIREVNADKDKAVMQEMEIKGFPTIIFLKDGKRLEYQGQRDISSLEKWVKKILNPHLGTDLKDYRSAR